MTCSFPYILSNADWGGGVLCGSSSSSRSHRKRVTGVSPACRGVSIGAWGFYSHNSTGPARHWPATRPCDRIHASEARLTLTNHSHHACPFLGTNKRVL